MAGRFLILTADAGFGHRSAADAIAAALREEGVDNENIDIVNLYEHPRVPAMLRDAQTDYDRVVREAPELYRFAYTASEQAIPNLVFATSVAALFFMPLRDVLASRSPDVVISTYPLYLPALVAIERIERRDIATMCAVTDLATVHRIWFEEGIDVYVVPTDAVAKLALQYHIPPESIRTYGIPVNPQLGRSPASKAELRRRLGWLPDAFTLFAVGSRRVQRLPEMLRGLNHSGLPIQLVVSAGRDEELHETLQQIEWHVPTHIHAFVSDMPAFLHASDCVLAKAGGLIVTETLAAGLPMLLTEVIPGQETGNAAFVVESGAGALAETPLDVLEAVCHWLADDHATLRAMADSARRAGKPDAARDVARLAQQFAQRSIAKRESAAPRDLLELGRLRAFLGQFGLMGDD